MFTQNVRWPRLGLFLSDHAARYPYDKLLRPLLLHYTPWSPRRIQVYLYILAETCPSPRTHKLLTSPLLVAWYFDVHSESVCGQLRSGNKTV